MLKKLQENIGYDRLCLYSMFCYSREIHAKRCVVKFFLKYKKFWEEGDHEAFTSIIDPEFEIIMHPTGGAMNYGLWMQRITSVVPSSAYAEKIRCLYENYEIMIFHQITNAANVARDAILYVFTKKGGMLVKLGI